MGVWECGSVGVWECGSWELGVGSVGWPRFCLTPSRSGRSGSARGFPWRAAETKDPTAFPVVAAAQATARVIVVARVISIDGVDLRGVGSLRLPPIAGLVVSTAL